MIKISSIQLIQDCTYISNTIRFLQPNFVINLYMRYMNFIFKLEELEQVANLVWKQNKQQKVWAFFAPMGVGKTTFIHTLCEKILQVQDNISSPTFAIINQYDSKVVGTILHMDWYRLKNEDEAFNAGVEDALYSGNICLVEWPEKAEDLLPEGTLKIYIEALDEHTRRIFTKDTIEVIL